MSFLDDWKEWSTPKKAISILVVCCIGIIIVGALTGGGSPDKNTGTTSSSNDNNSNSTTEQVKGVQLKVIYSGDWSGAYGEAGSTSSISGSGEKTIDMDIDSGMISINAQKQDSSSETLTVQILKDGNVVKEASTDAEYGVASVAEYV